MPSTNTVQPPNPPQTPPKAPTGFSVEFLIVLGIAAIALLLFSSSRGGQTEIPKGMPSAREATTDEIKKGVEKGKWQRAARVIGKSGVRLNLETGLVLADVNPGGCIPGASNMGKTKNCIIPIIESHCEDEDTVVVCDVKGDLMRETASYAKSLGYEIYVVAPGITYEDKYGCDPIQISDGINLCDFLKDSEDLEGALEITRALNLNTTKDPEKRHQYFGPQGDAAQEVALMTAKGSVHQDLLMSWEVLGLDRLAERLQAAYENEKMNGEDLPYYISHRSRGLRTVAKDKGSSNPGPTIQSTASQMLGKFIGPSIAKCLLKTTIPLDLHGKKIVYFRIDEDNMQATAPLVATMLHMLIRRNISNRRKRDNHFVLVADEASSYPLPSLHEWAALSRSNGFVAWLAYQQEMQMKFVYGDKWDIIQSNLRTKICFNQGDLLSSNSGKRSNEIISKAIGNKTIISSKTGRSHSNRSTTTSSNDGFEQIPLLSPEAIGRMKQGECVILSQGFNSRPVIYRDKPIPYALSGPIYEERKRLEKIWDDELVPALQEQHKENFGDIDVKARIESRTELSEIILPEPEIYQDQENTQMLADASQIAAVTGGLDA